MCRGVVLFFFFDNMGIIKFIYLSSRDVARPGMTHDGGAFMYQKKVLRLLNYWWLCLLSAYYRRWRCRSMKK